MPNECSNRFVLACSNAEEFNTVVERELTHDNITIDLLGARAVKFTQVTARQPDYEFLERLISNYPHCWIKNEWIEEGGTAGVWIGNVNGIQSLSWQDMSLEEHHALFQPPLH